MQQVLHAYKLRLTNLSQGNRSLKLGRLSTRRDIDLKDLGFLAEKSSEELLGQLIAGKDVTLIQRLDPRHEPTNLADRRLNSIYRSAQMLLEESGTYDLHLGYPFVEGKFLDGTAVRCPLLLFPVRLERNLQGRPRWKLKRLDEPVQFNPTFFLAYETYQAWRFSGEFWEEEIDDNKDWQVWMQDLYAKVKQYELAVNFNSDLFSLKLQRFPDMLKAAFDQLKTGVLTFRSQAVLGIFPQSDSTLLQDYETVEQQPEQFALGRYLDGEAQPIPEAKPIREEDRYFALPVDSAQEEALLMVKRGSSLVVHGPPGTGKSQVIVNLITDALAHGKQVLVVSQKRAALDVVFKRLDGLGLSRFAMLVHDHRHDRSVIYQKLHQQIQDIEKFQAEFRDLNKTVAEHNYRRLSREIDQQTRKLEALVRILQDRSTFGISAHELYLSCSPARPLIQLKEPAGKLTHDRLLELIRKLIAIRDYREFLSDDYPWKHRLSFRHYQQADRQRIQQKLEALPDQLKALASSWQSLDQKLGDQLLDTALNQERIARFRRFDGYYKRERAHRDLEALTLDGKPPSAVKKVLDRWDRQLDKLEACQLLNDEDWARFADLEKHTAVWKASREKALRWLSYPFLRARWYLFKLLSNKGKDPSPELADQLVKEFKHFQAVRSHYGQLHDHPFYQDFPLLGTQQEKQAWHELKTSHLEAWKDIRGLDFFANIRPELGEGDWDDVAWVETMTTIESLHRFNQALTDALRDWRLWLHDRQITRLTQGLAHVEATIADCEQLLETFRRDFVDLQALDRLLAELDPVEQQLFDLAEPALLEATSDEEFRDLILNSVYLHWLEALEGDHPVLTEVSSRGWERSLAEYRQHYEQRQPEVAALVARRLKEQVLEGMEFNRLNNRVTYRDIHHQVKKKRRLWPVRKLISETWDTGLQKLAPCWLASPESAAAMFPMQAELFDLVIFDEASQCFVERSLPVMLRGRQVVIAGDDQQLPPSDLYRVRYEEDIDAVDDAIPLEVVSVLDLARQTIPERRLNWHYRSESEALIAFSNQQFYDGTLQMIPPAAISPLHQPAIRWEAVQGTWQNNRNEAEAFRVVELILELSRREDLPSVGVVTFNFHQQELILDLLDQRLQQLADNDEAGYFALTNLMNRVAGEEHQGLFVKNIENVQGDERDVIIFSIAYARDDSGKLQTRFGLLNQAGGENRLNVAVTRARWQIFVVCSFLPEDLRVEHATHDGPKVFKAWLQYAIRVQGTGGNVHPPQRTGVSGDRGLGAGNKVQGSRSGFQGSSASADSWPGSDVDGKQAVTERSRSDAQDHALSQWLRQKLEAEGLEVVSGLGDSAWQLDLAVKRPGEAGYLAGIECEGPRYFRGLSAKERDLYRPALLLRQNWRSLRIWSRNVWLDAEKEWERVKGVIFG